MILESYRCPIHALKDGTRPKSNGEDMMVKQCIHSEMTGGGKIVKVERKLQISDFQLNWIRISSRK